MGDNKQIEIIQLTEESLMALLQGKYVHLNTIQNGKPVQFRFRGPWDGVFLTHAQLQDLEYQTERRVFSIMDKLQKIHTQKDNLETQK